MASEQNNWLVEHLTRVIKESREALKAVERAAIEGIETAGMSVQEFLDKINEVESEVPKNRRTQDAETVMSDYNVNDHKTAFEAAWEAGYRAAQEEHEKSDRIMPAPNWGQEEER